MKKLMLALFLLSASVMMIGTSSTVVYAKSGGNSNTIPASEVPSLVKKSFRTDYPDAKSVEWEYTPVYYGSSVYTANFKLGHDKWSASYYADGTRISAYPKP